jgi:hypothetical protein
VGAKPTKNVLRTAGNDYNTPNNHDTQAFAWLITENIGFFAFRRKKLLTISGKKIDTLGVPYHKRHPPAQNLRMI